MYSRRALARIVLFIVVVVGVGACYDPRIRQCAVTCSTAAECASGQSCTSGVCQAPGDSCPGTDAPEIDATDVDASMMDATDAAVAPSTWTKLSVGGYHACGIAATGVLWCWGNNDYRQLGRASPARSGAPLRVDAGAPTSDWELVAAGSRHSCGIRTDGTLWCWGLNESKQCGQSAGVFVLPSRVADPVGLTGDRWTAVTAGIAYTCALRDDGTLWCFGTGDAGQLGQNVAATTSAMPLRVGARTDWRSIESGYTHICGIYGPGGQRGHVACWGFDNNESRIGDGGNANRHVPTEVMDNGTSDWQRLSVGDYSACAIEAAGQVWCWGNRFQIPEGTTSPVPTRWGTVTGKERVSMGAFGGCVVDDGVASCFGYNYEGQLGIQPSGGTGTPSAIAGVTGVTEVGAGTGFACALDGGGAIWCWGDRGDGALGDGITGDSRQPVEVLGAHHPWRQVELGDEHTCGVTMAGAVYCWGSNYGGQIGGGSVMSAPIYEMPITVAVTGVFQKVTAGYAHGCAISDSGALWCWGNNDYGQRGASAATQYDPVMVDATALSALATGRHSNCGVTAGGARRCWGANDVSQLGNGGTGAVNTPTTFSETPTMWSKVSQGDLYGCGLSAGALHCWGYNNIGQTGQPVTTTIVPSPATIADPTPGTTDSWIDVAAGAGHSCALLSTDGTSGTIYCWGYNGRGQLGTVRLDGPMLTSVPGATNFIDVASGYGHTCGVRATGELHCWGSNDSGELGDGTTVPHVSIGATIGGMTDWHDVDAGTYVTCGIRGTERRLFCWGENKYGQAGTGGAVRWIAGTVPAPGDQ